MFQLPTFTSVTVRSLNVRAEMHGQEPVPAVDIGFRLTGSNKLLDMLDPKMRTGYYKRPGEEAPEPELDGIDHVDNLTELRIQHVKFPVKINREFPGRILVIDYGLGGKSNIDLSSADINDFSVTCHDGGTVDIDFRSQSSGVGDLVLGKLGMLVRHEVKITIMSSAAADGTQESIPGTKATPAAGDAKKPAPTDSEKAAAATKALIDSAKEDSKKPAAKKGKDPEREAERAKRFPSTAAKKPAAKKPTKK